MKRYMALIMLVAAQAVVHAQPGTGAITGTAKDARDKSIAGATVSLSAAGDSSRLPTTSTGKNGQFSLRHIAAGRYFVTVSSVGYASYHTPVFAYRSDSAGLDLTTIRLTNTASAMQVVTVTLNPAS